MTKVSVSVSARCLSLGGGQCSVSQLDSWPARQLASWTVGQARTTDDNHLIRNFPIGSSQRSVFVVSLFVIVVYSFYLYFLFLVFCIYSYSFASC